MSAIDYVIEHFGELYVDGFQRNTARAELAALRATTSELEEANRFVHLANDLITELRATVEAQARQLEQSKKLEQYVRNLNDYEVEFTACPVCDYPPIVCECGYLPIRAWLAANAPAPQAQPAQRVTAEDE